MVEDVWIFLVYLFRYYFSGVFNCLYDVNGCGMVVLRSYVDVDLGKVEICFVVDCDCVDKISEVVDCIVFYV